MSQTKWACEIEKQVNYISQHVTNMNSTNKPLASFKHLSGQYICFDCQGVVKIKEYLPYTSLQAACNFMWAMFNYFLEYKKAHMNEL